MASGLVENAWISSTFTASTFSPRRVRTGVSSASDRANGSSASGADRHCSHLETVLPHHVESVSKLGLRKSFGLPNGFDVSVEHKEHLLSNYPAIIAARPSLRQATHVNMAG